jgi:hypothetical protein
VPLAELPALLGQLVAIDRALWRASAREGRA